MTMSCFHTTQKLSRQISATQDLSIQGSQLQTMPHGDSSMLVNIKQRDAISSVDFWVYLSAATNPPRMLVAPKVAWWSQIKMFSFDLPAVWWTFSRDLLLSQLAFMAGAHWLPIILLHCHQQWLWMSHAPNSQREPGKLSGSIAIKKKGLRRNVQFTDVVENLVLFISRC